jgi:hypothetical protein
VKESLGHLKRIKGGFKRGGREGIADIAAGVMALASLIPGKVGEKMKAIAAKVGQAKKAIRKLKKSIKVVRKMVQVGRRMASAGVKVRV